MAETYLLIVIAVLFIALVIALVLGRLDARAAERLAVKNAELTAKVRHLQERNEELRDELDVATGSVEPSVVAEWTAFVAHVTPEDFR